MNNNTKLMLGVLAGAVAGFALGMMLAPQTGSDFRQSIRDSLDDLGDRVTDLFEEGRERLADLTGMSGNGIEEELPGLTGKKKAAL